MSSESMNIVDKVGGYAARAKSQLQQIPSPRDQYERKQAKVRKDIALTWQRLAEPAAQVNREELQERILSYGGELKTLELEYEATHEEAEKVYQQVQAEVVELLCNDVVEAFGEKVVEKMLHKVLASSSSQNATSDPSIRRSGRVPRPLGDRTSGLDPATERVPSRSNDAANNRASGSRKRRRVNERTIDFTQVFQDGRPSTPHVIVEYPEDSGKWYIFRCEEHDLDFKDNPIKGAAAHLGGDKHGRMSRAFAVAVKHLGIEVLGCNKSLAEKNNTVARGYIRKGKTMSRAQEETQDSSDNATDMGPLRHSRRARNQPVSQDVDLDNRNGAGDNNTDGLLDPTPGEVYLGYWEKSKQWTPVLVLSTTDQETPGIAESLEELGLTDNIPECYYVEGATGRLEWQLDYDYGGDLISERQFPVMYFDGLRFPERSAVGWVAARNLKTFDLESHDPLIPNLSSVRSFLQEREVAQQKEVVAGGSSTNQAGSQRSSNEIARRSRFIPPPDNDIMDLTPGTPDDTLSVIEMVSLEREARSEVVPDMEASVPLRGIHPEDVRFPREEVHSKQNSHMENSYADSSATQPWQPNQLDISQSNPSILASIAQVCLGQSVALREETFSVNDPGATSPSTEEQRAQTSLRLSTTHYVQHSPVSDDQFHHGVQGNPVLPPIHQQQQNTRIFNGELPPILPVANENSRTSFTTGMRLEGSTSAIGQAYLELPGRAAGLLMKHWNNKEAPGTRGFCNSQGLFMCPVCRRSYSERHHFLDHVVKDH